MVEIMARRELKRLARSMYLDGKFPSEISDELNVPLRTMQRWVQEFKNEAVTVEIESIDKTEDAIVEVKKLQKDETVALTISSQTAIQLLHLGQSAIATVERILGSPDAPDKVKLEAAKLSGAWTGLDQTNVKLAPKSMMQIIAAKTGIVPRLEDSESSTIDLTPVIRVRKEHEEKEQAIKEAQRQISRTDREMKALAEEFENNYSSSPNYTPLVKSENFRVDRFMYFLDLQLEQKEKVLNDLVTMGLIDEQKREDTLFALKYLWGLSSD